MVIISQNKRFYKRVLNSVREVKTTKELCIIPVLFINTVYLIYLNRCFIGTFVRIRFWFLYSFELSLIPSHRSSLPKILYKHIRQIKKRLPDTYILLRLVEVEHSNLRISTKSVVTYYPLSHIKTTRSYCQGSLTYVTHLVLVYLTNNF